MDIFSHGLWAGAGAKMVNNAALRQAQGRYLNVYRTAFWGAFPDLFAFTIPFIWLIWNVLVGNPVSMISPGNEEPISSNGWPFQIAHNLYNVSHSLAVFFAVSAIVFILFKFGPFSFKIRRLPWEMGGWFLHILMDVPTHSYRFFPTPIFWPISEWKFDGASWADPNFLTINYLLLAIVYGALLIIRRRKFFSI